MDSTTVLMLSLSNPPPPHTPHQALATIEFSWEDVEAEAAVVERFAQRVSALQSSHGEERLHATLRVVTTDAGGQDVAQGPHVELQLQHSLSHPALRCISVSDACSMPALRVTPCTEVHQRE